MKLCKPEYMRLKFVLQFASCVTLGKLANLPVPLLLILKRQQI